MANIQHGDLAAGVIHIPYNWQYADASARTGASGFVSGDIGKLARQLDDNSLWMLTATTPTWVAVGIPNPMTTQDDLIVGGASGVETRLAKGSDSQVLTVDPTTHHLVWATPASGFADPTTTKGDLIVHGSSTTRMGVGSDGAVLTADSTQTLGVKWAAASGGGSASGYGTFASKPSAGTAGNLYTPTDGYTQWIDDGAVWRPILVPGSVGKDPTTPSWAWINQNSATVSTTGGAVSLDTPSIGASTSLAIRKKAAPSTPYTITATFTMGWVLESDGAGSGGAGLIFRQSSDGKLMWMYVQPYVGYFLVTSFSSPTAGVSNVYLRTSSIGVMSMNEVWHFRIADNGTNRLYSVSSDGRNFLQLYSEARTTYLTADEVGFAVNGREGEVCMTLLSWVEA